MLHDSAKRLLIVVAILLVAACGGPTVSDGKIVKKWHADAYTWVSYICASYGKYGCNVQVPLVHDEPEQWWITLENCELRAEGDHDCPRSDWHLDEHVWANLDTGQHYTVPGQK